MKISEILNFLQLQVSLETNNNRLCLMGRQHFIWAGNFETYLPRCQTYIFHEFLTLLIVMTMLQGLIYTITDVEEVHDWMVLHISEHPLFTPLTQQEMVSLYGKV